MASSASDVYKNILTEALTKCPFTLTDEMMDRIGQRTLDEMERLYTGNGLQPEPNFALMSARILQAAKEANRTRSFAINACDYLGRFSNISGFTHTNVTLPDVGEGIFSGLKDFVSDFGSSDDKFCSSCYGHHSSVGNALDPSRDDLSPDRLFTNGILKRPYTLDLGNNADPLSDSGAYIHVDPIKITFYYHNPSEVPQV